MNSVTELIARVEEGDVAAAKQLLPLVYNELRKLAAVRLAAEKPGQTLQPTALVHEAYVRLVGVNEAPKFNSRGHFFAAAAEAMRRILVENARRKNRDKHGGHYRRVDADLVDLACVLPDEELVSLDEALAQLQVEDSIMAGNIIVWNLEDGEILHRVQFAHQGGIESLDFSSDARLASCGHGGVVKIWQWTDTTLTLEMQHHEHRGSVHAVAFSHDGTILASGDTQDIILWNTFRQEAQITIQAHVDELRTLEFSSDDTTLLSASRDKTVKLWEVPSGKLLMSKMVHSSVSTSATFLDTELIASVGFDGTLAIWKTTKDPNLHHLSLNGPVTDVALTLDGRYLLANRADPPAIVRIDVDNGGQFELPVARPGHVIASSSTGLLAIGELDGHIHLYDLENWGYARRLHGQHKKAVWRVAFAPQGDQFASLGLDGKVKVWDSKSCNLTKEFVFSPPPIQRIHIGGPLAYSPDGKYFAWADGDHSVVMHNLQRGETRHLQGHKKSVLTLAFSPDGQHIATSDWGGTVYLWNVANDSGNKRGGRFIEHPLWIHALAFAPDEKTLVVSCGDSTLHFWDLETLQQKCVFSHDAFSNLKFSLDGNFLFGVVEHNVNPSVAVLRQIK